MRGALLAVSTTVFASLPFALPANSADDPPPITKKDLNASKSNLKEIAIGVHNFAGTYLGKLPGNILGKDDKPLLSWRVAILPHINEEELYKQFRLDEPWDSDDNKKLIEKIPKIYAPVRVKAKAGETFYQVFTGKNALFDLNSKDRPIFPTSIPDGTYNTGMVFEAGEPVVWSKPADLLFDQDKPLPKLGGMFDGECLVATCDGTVRHLKKNPDEKQMKYLIMPADGNIVDFDLLDY